MSKTGRSVPISALAKSMHILGVKGVQNLPTQSRTFLLHPFLTLLFEGGNRKLIRNIYQYRGFFLFPSIYYIKFPTPFKEFRIVYLLYDKHYI